LAIWDVNERGPLLRQRSDQGTRISLKGLYMTKVRMRQLAIFAAVAVTLSQSAAKAQVFIDMSRITCVDYLAMPPERARVFAAWMSGWFNQKTGYVWVNLEAYARNVANVRAWCAANPQELVMTGLERATKK
jgi:HdeA/HdeB family